MLNLHLWFDYFSCWPITMSAVGSITACLTDGLILGWPQKRSYIFLVNSFGEFLNLWHTRWERSLGILLQCNRVKAHAIINMTSLMSPDSLEIWRRAIQDCHALPLCYSRSHPPRLCGCQLLLSHWEKGFSGRWRQLWSQTSGDHKVRKYKTSTKWFTVACTINMQ